MIPSNIPGGSATTRDLLDYARGSVSGVSTFHRFGYNPSVGTSLEDVWGAGTAVTWLTTAATLRIQAGGNAADDAAGLGAQQISITYLNASYAEVTETLATAGASASAVTSQTAIRLIRAFVTEVGAYSAANTGDITIETSGGTVMGFIAAGVGQTQQSHYTVPAAKTAYLANVTVNGDQTRVTDVRLFQRQASDDVTGPTYTAKRLVMQIGKLQLSTPQPYIAYPSFPAKTDIWVEAQVNSSTGSVSVDYDLFLVDD